MSDTPNPPSMPPGSGGNIPPTDPMVPNPSPTGHIPDPADVEKNKIFAILAYLWILVLVPILAARQSPFARYHANQGLLLCCIAIACVIVMMCAGFGAVIPGVGWILACGLWVVAMAVWIAILVYVVLGIVNAANGRMKPLPGFPEITLIK